jgi:hypothetical protein
LFDYQYQSGSLLVEIRRIRQDRDKGSILLSNFKDAKMQATQLAVSVAMLMTMVGPSYAAEQQFLCKGQLVQQMPDPAIQPKRIDLNVTLGGKDKLSLIVGNDKLATRVTSNNKIQLKFVTKEFVGEYFHYTGDMFLIYNSGPLARLSCAAS